MVDRAPFVSFLSDLGTADESVGACKGVILTIAPHARILDIAHDLPPFDVRGASLALVRAIQYLPDGIVLAVVDPSVGSLRRAIAVEIEDGVLLGPDNGLLAPAVALMGGATRVVSLDAEEYHLEAPGITFAARDIFAAAAGHLASGVSLDVLGTDVDPDTLAPGIIPVSQTELDRVIGSVWWVDRFGNAQLNIDPAELSALGAHVDSTLEVHVGETVRMARWVSSFAEARPSELSLIVDGAGLVVLALDKASAATEYGLHDGVVVSLVPPPRRGTSIPVRAEVEE